MSEKAKSFTSAGKDVVEGFASGISKNTYLAEAKARAMAAAAAEAARKALEINSPSKIFMAIGASVPEGLALGINNYGGMVEDSVASMTTSPLAGIRNAISTITDLFANDIDAEPVISPVIDLSNVESGARAIGRIMNIGSSIGLRTNVGAIDAGMSLRGQNGNAGGSTSNSNQVTYNTYNIDGVTYDDGSNIASAVEEIVHAARVERRT